MVSEERVLDPDSTISPFGSTFFRSWRLSVTVIVSVTELDGVLLLEFREMVAVMSSDVEPVEEDVSDGFVGVESPELDALREEVGVPMLFVAVHTTETERELEDEGVSTAGGDIVRDLDFSEVLEPFVIVQLAVGVQLTDHICCEVDNVCVNEVDQVETLCVAERVPPLDIVVELLTDSDIVCVFVSTRAVAVVMRSYCDEITTNSCTANINGDNLMDPIMIVRFHPLNLSFCFFFCIRAVCVQ